MVFHRIQIPMQGRYQKGHFKELCLHTDLVLVFDIKSSTFDEVFYHWQVSIEGCNVECCILCISEIKHVTSHFRSKVLGNANMPTTSRQVKSIESILWMYNISKIQYILTYVNLGLNTTNKSYTTTYASNRQCLSGCLQCVQASVVVQCRDIDTNTCGSILGAVDSISKVITNRCSTPSMAYCLFSALALRWFIIQYTNVLW